MTDRNYDLHEVPGAAYGSAKKDAKNALVAAARGYLAGTDPVRLAASQMAAGAKDTAKVAGGSLMHLMTPQMQAILSRNPQLKSALESSSAFSADLMRKYGGYENLKRTIAEHPYQFIADASILVPGAGVAGRGVASVVKTPSVKNALSRLYHEEDGELRITRNGLEPVPPRPMDTMHKFRPSGDTSRALRTNRTTEIDTGPQLDHYTHQDIQEFREHYRWAPQGSPHLERIAERYGHHMGPVSGQIEDWMRGVMIGTRSVDDHPLGPTATKTVQLKVPRPISRGFIPRNAMNEIRSPYAPMLGEKHLREKQQ